MAGAIAPNYFEFGVHKTTVPMSDFAVVNDAVLRSDNNIMLQSGTGAAALFIKKSDNKIGIGNSAPSEVLDVTGFTKSSSGYKTGTFGKVIDDLGNFTGLNLTIDTHTLYVDATKRNVGIGTSTPANTLHVAGVGRIDSGLYFVNGGSGGAFVWNIANEALRFGTNDTERMRITSSGNLLIGTTTDAGQKLQVNGSALIDGLIQTNTSLFIGNQALAGTYYISIAPSTSVPANIQGSLAGTGTAPISLNSVGGNVLIGTATNGASKLRIVGLPTSAVGLSSGDIYSNAGILTIVP
jgi:hypothetical protein